MVRGVTPQPEEPNTLSFMIEGDVHIQVDVIETGEGGLEFKLTVLDTGDNVADIRGFFFDFADPALIDGLEVEGDEVSGSKFAMGKVANLGKGNNMHGIKSDDGSQFDGGIAFGKPGMGQDDDLQEVSFTLSHPDMDLTLDDLANMDFGLRLTSVGPEDGARDASLKIVSEIPDHEEPEDPDGPDGPPNPEETPEEPEEPEEPEDPEEPVGPPTPPVVTEGRSAAIAELLENGAGNSMDLDDQGVEEDAADELEELDF